MLILKSAAAATAEAAPANTSSVSHHPFQAEIDHLVECVRHGRESHCNLEDAIKTHEIAFAAIESCRTRQPVRLPLLDPND